jgi:hypothetical protein
VKCVGFFGKLEFDDVQESNMMRRFDHVRSQPYASPITASAYRPYLATQRGSGDHLGVKQQEYGCLSSFCQFS